MKQFFTEAVKASQKEIEEENHQRYVNTHIETNPSAGETTDLLSSLRQAVGNDALLKEVLGEMSHTMLIRLIDGIETPPAPRAPAEWTDGSDDDDGQGSVDSRTETDGSIASEAEESEEYECPECGAKITVDMSVCPNCGIGLSFEYEDENEPEE